MNSNERHKIKDEDIVSDINMTPLIDIMLVILIIFMISSSVVVDSGLDINLPQAYSAQDKSEQNYLVVSISKDGGIYILGEKIKVEDLKETMKAALEKQKTDAVVLQADAESQLSLSLTVMDTAQLAGAKSFSIGTQPK